MHVQRRPSPGYDAGSRHADHSAMPLPLRLRPVTIALGLLLASAPVAAQVLHDNGPLVTGTGNGAGGADTSAVLTTLEQTVTGYAASASGTTRVADDFTVPAGGWLLSGLVLFGFQTGADAAVPALQSAHVRLWDGPPDQAGSVMLLDSGATAATATSANAFRVVGIRAGDTRRPIERLELAMPRVLHAGTYWLDWQLAGSEAAGPYVPPVTRAGQAGTGNARQFRGGAWHAIAGTGSGESLPFQLLGGVLPSDVFADSFEQP